jgi:glutamate-5-semialdehyde dehydrogenase
MDLEIIAKKSKWASRKLAAVSSEKKNNVLRKMADMLIEKTSFVIENNKKDIENAKAQGLSSAIIDRLTLDPKRIKAMADGLGVISGLHDPVGEIIRSWKRPNGLLIERVRVPIGVIFIVYESRPNVTVDSAGLCFKSGNCVILRGGKESIYSNKALVSIMHEALEEHGIEKDCMQLIETTDRSAVTALLKMTQYIDLVIPRGGEQLIRVVVEESRIPVIKHYKGICHVYVDKDADMDIAEKIVVNAKVQRPGVCNAMETLLVHKDIAKDFLPCVSKNLSSHRVELRGCEESRKIVPSMIPAKEEDWSTEYLDLILSVKIVENLDDAIWHINNYGSMHSDSIITNDNSSAEKFVKEVDSACVFVNASTRFSDGGEFGMGAEIGISTDKIHARGPMGLEELTSYKYIVKGKGQIRE